MLNLNSILVIFFLGVCDNFIFLIQIGFYLQIFPLLKLLLRQLLFLWLWILLILTGFAQVLILSLQTFGCLRSLWCHLIFSVLQRHLTRLTKWSFSTVPLYLLANMLLYIFHVEHLEMFLLTWLTALVLINWLGLIWIEAHVLLVYIWVYFLVDFNIAFSVATKW